MRQRDFEKVIYLVDASLASCWELSALQHSVDNSLYILVKLGFTAKDEQHFTLQCPVPWKNRVGNCYRKYI